MQKPIVMASTQKVLPEKVPRAACRNNCHLHHHLFGLWEPWKILKGEGQQRSTVATEYSEEPGLVELGYMQTNSLPRAESVTPFTLTSTQNLRQRIGQLYSGSHPALRTKLVSLCEKGYVICARVAQVHNPEINPFIIKNETMSVFHYKFEIQDV